jgi:hypothetical protein
VGGGAADAREAELLCDCGHDWDCAVRGDGEDAVNSVPARDLENRFDVCEVDDLGDVCGGEPRRLLVTVDADDPKAAGARMLDRAPLMPPGADEEDGLHARRC